MLQTAIGDSERTVRRARSKRTATIENLLTSETEYEQASVHITVLQTRFQCPGHLVPRGLSAARGFLQVAVPLALGSAFAGALSPQSPSAPGRQPLTVPPAPHKPPSPASAGPVPQSPGRDAVSASARTLLEAQSTVGNTLAASSCA